MLFNRFQATGQRRERNIYIYLIFQKKIYIPGLTCNDHTDIYDHILNIYNF